jgi:hypothetical protein
MQGYMDEGHECQDEQQTVAQGGVVARKAKVGLANERFVMQ